MVELEHDEHTHHSHTHPHTHTHDHESTRAVVNRLARAIGHLSSVKQMVQDERDCSEVLIQLAAVRSAIGGVCRLILKEHIEHCLLDALESGDTEELDELNKAIEMLMK